MRAASAPSEEPRGKVLVVEDDPAVRRIIERAVRTAHFQVIVAASVDEAVHTLRDRGAEIDVVVTDLMLEDGTGMDVVATARAEAPDTVVVVVTAQGTVPNAVAAIKAGAYDFLSKPFDPPALVRTLERAHEKRRLVARTRFLESKVEVTDRFPGLIGQSPQMRKLFALIESVGPVDSTVLVLGESGTGKELVARAVHDRSPRASKPFLAVNCGALAESVLESELFGHTRGAFTGAVAARKGLFEEASGGTIFLDEVGETPMSIQVRLLRVLEQREVRAVGSNETRKIDVRVIAATNRDLASAARSGAFREDLFYRLNVVSIEAPALRDRTADIPLLVHHFIATCSRRLQKNVTHIEPDALGMLCAHPWPGNVRELQNAIERAVLLARGGVITVDALPSSVARAETNERVMRKPYTLPLARAVAAFERNYVEHVLREARGNIAEAARAAGLDRSNFRRLMKKHDLQAVDFGAPPSPPRSM